MKAKLSELIRLGSMISGQAFQTMMDPDGNTCAQGAALVALGVPAEQIRHLHQICTAWDHPLAAETLPFLLKTEIDPIADEVNQVGSIIVQLNDLERWSREKI